MTAPATARPVPAPGEGVEVLHRGATLARPAPPQRHRPTRSGSPRRTRRGPEGVHPRPGHIPGLDGIRAVAIVGVLVYHFTPHVLPGGFLGVDVFFVVSGFLITTLLLRELVARGRVDLPQFWLRRARRLVPALVTVVLVSVGAARLVGGDLLVDIGRQTLGALTFSTNWLEVSAGASYFHSTSPLLFVNFWSLAVEEQFYLLWPFGLVLVVALTRTTRQRLAAAGGLALASALLMAVLHRPGEDATRVYYGTDTHLFGLMLGVALAFAWAGPERAWLRTATWRRWRGTAVTLALGVLVLLMAGLSDTSGFTFRGGILLACLATVVLLAGLLESPSPWRRLMELAPLTWLGRRSYGIYLWHWPVLMILSTLVPFADGTPRAWTVLAGALTLTLVVTEASYRWIEGPVRRQGFAASLRRLLGWVTTPWANDRRPRLAAGGLAGLVLLSAVAVVTAPEMSATQRAIQAAEAELDLSQRPAPEAPVEQVGEAGEAGEDQPSPPEEPAAQEATPDGYTADEDGLLVPAGEDLTAIGDSLVVTSADGLRHRFPGITFVAKSNRQWKDAMPVLTAADADGAVHDNVVVHFGTNAGVDEAALRAVLAELGPQRRVVVMNLYSTSTFVPKSNQVIGEVVAEHPNAVVGDWHSAIAAQPEALQSDRTHPDIAGMHVYAEVVARSFDELARRSGPT